MYLASAYNLLLLLEPLLFYLFCFPPLIPMVAGVAQVGKTVLVCRVGLCLLVRFSIPSLVIVIAGELIYFFLK